MLSKAGSVEEGPGCIEQGSELNVDEIREQLRLLLDLSSRLPSKTVLSLGDATVFRDSCSALEKVLTAPTRKYDDTQYEFSDRVDPRGDIAEDHHEATHPEDRREEALQYDRELLLVLDRLTKANENFRQRRVEQRQIHEQYQIRCKEFSARVSELEDEVKSLQEEAFNATIELECMRGTVSGLDSWLSNWKSQNDSDSHPGPVLKRPAKPRGKSSKYFEQLDKLQEQRDGLIDGLGAWMRGWNDATDGFRARSTS
ncbi:TPA_exp: Uncharacterized protein A8136_7230 [Trichophyton benhamiae CBS 112371]|uniref:Uncharacterized protein n=1 Tax=Arthroderma benhamiae (strain ATCC MYA-4681 / CBS 112371) TaxID=663331 RepID=D4ATA8_ARTBC|nr:uncharacterized protein ARB_07472 [Trichophyton benhamiae CBS 112371]EFE33527.1 hypothetical protein ARB_07472 [Trichophyton benhamiae CBS 112371]DAA76553.1 TPA_exp: Uncharacterized protein A8136_7230 [Trichophyton benhamiae CBS 112371]